MKPTFSVAGKKDLAEVVEILPSRGQAEQAAKSWRGTGRRARIFERYVRAGNQVARVFVVVVHNDGRGLPLGRAR